MSAKAFVCFVRTSYGGRVAGCLTTPQLEPHRALLRQWAPDKIIHMIILQ